MQRLSKLTPALFCTVLLSLLVLFSAVSAVRQSLPPYHIIIGRQSVSCLPWDVFFWIKPEKVVFKRYDLVLFDARNMGPFFPEGAAVVKMAAGMPGDRILIKAGKLYINGQLTGDVRDGARALKKPMDYWDTEYVLGADEVFMLGTEPRSYDSRYWGPYPRHRVRGSVSVLF